MRRALALPAVVAALYAVVLLALLDTVEPAPLELPPPPPPVAAPPDPNSEGRFARLPPTRAVAYAGRESALNFWSSDLSRVDADFARIRRDGFDAVLLTIPWGEFQPTLFPPTVDGAAFGRLARVLDAAHRHDLGVVARLSYAHDVAPAVQLPGRDRFRFVFGDENVYAAWRSYVAAVGRTLARSPSFRFAFLSWEDFWGVVRDAQAVDSEPVRRRIALDTGFAEYLSARYSLEEVAERYGRPLATWRELAVAPPESPAFDLFVEFVGAALVDRFYRPARIELPHLSLEPPPPPESSSNVAARLPRGAFATVSFPPVPAPAAEDVSAAAGLRRLGQALRVERRRSRGRVFVGRLALEGAVGGEVEAFVRCLEPLLRRDTLGYAAGPYRAGPRNTVFNPSFALGREGWRARGGARLVDPGAIRLDSRARVEQQVGLESAAGAELRVELVAQGAPGARLTVALDGVSRALAVPAARRTIRLAFAAAGGPSALLSIAAAGGAATVDDVAVYGSVEGGAIRGRAGEPGPALEPLRRLNSSLAQRRGRAERSSGCPTPGQG